MNDDKMILDKLNNSDQKRKKMLLIAGVVAILIALIVILVIVLKPNKEESDSKNVSSSKKFDTTLTGDAKMDPENDELSDEIGAIVDAEELVANKERTNGIDVSKWQGKIDWEKVKQSGIEFAFIRIGYRGENGIIYKDDNADYNIQQAQKAGVLVGVYFFSTAVSEAEALEEAKWTSQAIEGYSISYPVVYDCEGFSRVTSRMHSLTKEERTNNALAFLKEVKSVGYDAMFYGALNELKNSADWDIAKIEKKYKVWVAQYPSVTYPEKIAPDYNRELHTWQYTNKGSVNGISGNVDMVVCYFKTKLAKPKNKNATPPTAKAPLTDEEKLYTAVNETVTAKEVTNLRAAATTKSDIVISLKNGETITRIGIGSNGWSKLQYNGQIVYAISSYLTTDLTPKTPTETPAQDIVAGHIFTPHSDSVTAKEEVNLRSLPTTNSEVIGKLLSGEFLQRTAVSDKGWSRLNYNGQTVYAVTSYLSNEVIVQKPEAPETPSSSDGFTAVDEQVTAKEETNLRTSPSTQNSEVVHLLKNGEYVRRIGVHTNGWSKLEYNGQIVYAITSYLTN